MKLPPRLHLLVALLVALVGVAAVAPGRAAAQASPQAEALFRDGKRLMKEGRYDEACAAFEGSERAEHSVATVLSLADCREKNRQLASAWALFLQAESQTRGDATKATLRETAHNRALALEPLLSYLTINVPDESRVPDLEVTRDGVPVDPAQWNRALPIDGGRHVIAGKAPGHEPWSSIVELGAQLDRRAVEVPRFKALRQLAERPAATAGTTTPPPGEDDLVHPPARSSSRWSTRRRVAVGVAAGSLVVAGLATYVGVDALDLRDRALATCPPQDCSVADAAAAQELNDRARRRAVIANVGFGVAGAAAVTAVVLWLTGGPERTLALAPWPTSRGLALTGSF